MFYGCPTSEINIRAGTKLLFRQIPESIPKVLNQKIREAIHRVEGVGEAYLTSCRLPSEGATRLVLVVGIAAGFQQHAIARRLLDELDPVRWNDCCIDIIPFDSTNVPQAVLETGTKIV